MAPSFDCMISLLCAEEAIGGVWEDADEARSYDEEQETDECACDGEDEMISVLIEKEGSLMPRDDYIDMFDSRIGDARTREQAVNWMLDVQAFYHFQSLTRFLSVTYFDRFLSSHDIPRGKPWMLQLLAVGCVSLAAKMEETEVPLLLDLQIGDLQHVFEARTIQRMELLILSTLNWRMSPVTPFSYVNFLLHKIGTCWRSSLAVRARVEELILNTRRGMRFLAYRPSVVALAAMMRACEDQLPPLQATMHQKVLLSALPVDLEDALECARVMQELESRADPFWTSNCRVMVSNLARQSEMGMLEEEAMMSSENLTSRWTGLAAEDQDQSKETEIPIATIADEDEDDEAAQARNFEELLE